MNHSGVVPARHLSILTLSALFLIAALPESSQAQGDVEAMGRAHGVRPGAGYYQTIAQDPHRFEFRYVWLQKARRVAERRAWLKRQMDLASLNAAVSSGHAAAGAAAAAVSGTLKIPVLTGMFKNTTSTVFDSSTYQAALFGTGSPPPYTVTTFYNEISRGMLNLTGIVYDSVRVDSVDTYYEGPSGCNGIGISVPPPCGHVDEYLDAIYSRVDPGIDFGQFDNDGPDGVPNSGDDDGFVDLVAVLHPEVGGECGNDNLWAHRSAHSYTTDDPAAGGGNIRIFDYLLQSAVGGSTGCTSTQIMPIGTMSHELGHGLGLPDLYDTSNTTEGIGEWGLMGAGNWNIQSSPAHMEAWSLDQLGWAVLDTILGSSGFRAVDLQPIEFSDTALVLCTNAASCFTNEYFLLENRQAIGSDANVYGGGGLMIWHVDPSVIATWIGSNQVNANSPHGVALEQADGLGDLESKANRGDGGDPYPGTTNASQFGPTSTPSSDLNDGSASNILVDSIMENPDSSVHFAVNYNTVEERVTTNVPGTQVKVDGSPQATPHVTVWTVGDMHSIGVDSIQGDTLSRYLYQSWSDAGARTHNVNVDATPDTFTATLGTEHRLRATVDSGGTLTSSTALDANDKAWFAEGAVDTLVAEADTAAGFVFGGWSGDTATANDTLIVTMSKPYSVNADVGAPVSITSASLKDGVMGAASYADTLRAIGGIGTVVWTMVSGSLPAGLSLDTTGVISGSLDEDGTFQFVVNATAGPLSAEDTISLTVTRPTLALQSVVDELLKNDNSLTADEKRFLDLIGNQNGSFDIGDFRAHLKDTGVIADIAPTAAKATAQPTDRAGPGKKKEEGGKHDSGDGAPRKGGRS